MTHTHDRTRKRTRLQLVNLGSPAPARRGSTPFSMSTGLSSAEARRFWQGMAMATSCLCPNATSKSLYRPGSALPLTSARGCGVGSLLLISPAACSSSRWLNCVLALARNVQCPAVWPGDSSKSKVKGAYAYIDDQTQPPWEESKHGTRVESVVYGEYVDLQCLYANWRTLFFQLHGEEKECHEIILSFATKPPRRWRRQTCRASRSVLCHARAHVGTGRYSE